MNAYKMNRPIVLVTRNFYTNLQKSAQTYTKASSILCNQISSSSFSCHSKSMKLKQKSIHHISCYRNLHHGKALMILRDKDKDLEEKIRLREERMKTKYEKSYEEIVNEWLGNRPLQFVFWTLGGYGVKPKNMFYAKRLYTTIYTHAEKEYWNEDLHLPDTFNSWFMKVHLHVWMTYIRLGSIEGGNYLRKELHDVFVEDIEHRVRLLGVGDAFWVSKTVSSYTGMMNGLYCAYDDGLVGEDTVLSGALWRNYFNKSCDMERLSALVGYVRREIHVTENIQDSEIMQGRIKFGDL